MKNAVRIIRQNLFYYATGLAILFLMKLFYSKAGCKELDWILAPTAWWAGILSGIPFHRDPAAGYVNHDYRFIIAPSCSGVQFMMITCALLIISFVHLMKTRAKSICWIGSGLIISYLYTIIVNGLRIVISIYLPSSVPQAFGNWLTPERLHTMVGIILYFTALSALYRLTERSFKKSAQHSEASISGPVTPRPDGMPPRIIHRFLPPVFWYFAIALGVPFLNRAYAHNGAQFFEYALLMSAVCIAIILLSGLADKILRKLRYIM